MAQGGRKKEIKAVGCWQSVIVLSDNLLFKSKTSLLGVGNKHTSINTEEWLCIAFSHTCNNDFMLLIKNFSRSFFYFVETMNQEHLNKEDRFVDKVYFRRVERES